MPTKLQTIADAQRKEQIDGNNLYKINSPYDLNDDAVTRSINLLNRITGFDYRQNSVINIVERLVDAQNSKLLQIGASRLLVEFGRRSVYNILDGFIPAPNDLLPNFAGGFKKHDASITDPNKNPFRTFTDRALEGAVGYRSNENYLLTFDSNLKNGAYNQLSDMYFYHSGNLIQERIKQLGSFNTFSRYSDNKNINSKYESIIFQNTYNSNTSGTIDILSSPSGAKNPNVFTHSYFKNYEKPSGSLTNNYIQERKDLEKEQGFGSLAKKPIDETKNIGLQNAVIFDSRDSNPAQVTERQDLYKNSDGSFIYDSNYEVQDIILEDHKVKRGLIYFTSRLALENDIIKGNNIIAQNKKEIYTDVDVNTNVAYYKGNGECRTFTVYQQHDNFSKLIRFDGNNEKNSVLKDSVLPKIAPYEDDIIDDRRRYFFTMENLAVRVTNDSDGDQGPNGGRWMWFPPYDVKISDNNSVNWADMNFLGRPEPIFSYQNTVRSLSLSFRLLIDTVKEMQDLKSTIENYRAYLHNCGEYDFDIQAKIDSNTEVQKQGATKVKKRKEETKFIKAPVTYFFKNNYYDTDTVDVDYSSLDDCKDSDINGTPDAKKDVFELSSTTLAFNENFVATLSAATVQLKELIDLGENVVQKIEININGSATDLFTKKDRGSTKARNYNRNLSWSRAYGFMTEFISYYNNINGTNKIPPPSSANIAPTDDNKLPGKKNYEFLSDNKISVVFNLDPKGDSLSFSPSTYENRNDLGQIQERNASMKGFKVTFKQQQLEALNTEDLNTDIEDKKNQGDLTKLYGLKKDPALSLDFEELKINNKFPTGFEKLNVFSPVFNSQTPFDFTKRYVFLHQLTRPSKLKNNNAIDNTVFGRMPVFILRYGDFLHTKAIARSINFDIQESTWDLNPEGMGVIPLMCNVTMDLTLLGGQSLAGPLDRIQTANDSSFIANTSFNSGRYYKNVRFASSRKEEGYQYKGKGSGEDKSNATIKTPSTPASTGNNNFTPTSERIPDAPRVNPPESSAESTSELPFSEERRILNETKEILNKIQEKIKQLGSTE